MCVILIVGVILFIVWQFSLLKKYTLHFDKFKINLQEKCVFVNGRSIRFDEIDHITVQPLEQPTLAEKALSRSAVNHYMAQMTFHLKQGTPVECVFNYKGALYKALTQLKPHVRIDASIETYNDPFKMGAASYFSSCHYYCFSSSTVIILFCISPALSGVFF